MTEFDNIEAKLDDIRDTMGDLLVQVERLANAVVALTESLRDRVQDHTIQIPPPDSEVQ